MWRKELSLQKKKVGKVLCKHRNLHTYWFSHFSLHFTAAQCDSWDVTSSIENIMKQWMKRSIIRSGLRVDLTCVCDRMCRTMQAALTDIASRWRTFCVCIFNSNDNIIRLLPWMHRARIVSRPSDSYCVSLTTTENSQSNSLYGGEMTRHRWGKKIWQIKSLTTFRSSTSSIKLDFTLWIIFRISPFVWQHKPARASRVSCVLFSRKDDEFYIIKIHISWFYRPRQ